MSEEERRERHRQSYMHVLTHTAQVGGGGGCEGIRREVSLGFTGRQHVPVRARAHAHAHAKAHACVLAASRQPPPPRRGRTPSSPSWWTPTSRPTCACATRRRSSTLQRRAAGLKAEGFRVPNWRRRAARPRASRSCRALPALQLTACAPASAASTPPCPRSCAATARAASGCWCWATTRPSHTPSRCGAGEGGRCAAGCAHVFTPNPAPLHALGRRRARAGRVRCPLQSSDARGPQTGLRTPQPPPSPSQAPRQPKRHFDQIKALTRVNPRVLECIKELCADPANVVVVFSGSEVGYAQRPPTAGMDGARGQRVRARVHSPPGTGPRAPTPPTNRANPPPSRAAAQCHKLEETFGSLPVWLAAENGVYFRGPPDAAGRAAVSARAAHATGSAPSDRPALAPPARTPRPPALPARPHSPPARTPARPHVRPCCTLHLLTAASAPAAAATRRRAAGLGVPVRHAAQGVDGERAAGAGLLLRADAEVRVNPPRGRLAPPHTQLRPGGTPHKLAPCLTRPLQRPHHPSLRTRPHAPRQVVCGGARDEPGVELQARRRRVWAPPGARPAAGAGVGVAARLCSALGPAARAPTQWKWQERPCEYCNLGLLPEPCPNPPPPSVPNSTCGRAPSPMPLSRSSRAGEAWRCALVGAAPSSARQRQPRGGPGCGAACDPA
jgi:hypothetical protein